MRGSQVPYPELVVLVELFIMTKNNKRFTDLLTIPQVWPTPLLP